MEGAPLKGGLRDPVRGVPLSLGGLNYAMVVFQMRLTIVIEP